MARVLLFLAVVLSLPGCGSGSGGGTTFVVFAPSFAMDGVRVNAAAGASTSDEPRVCCDGLNVYVVWHDDRDTNEDIYLNYSRDGGVTWEGTDIRIDTGDAAGAARSLFPEICCDGNRVYVVWQDDRNGANDIYFNYSADAGVSWQAGAIRLDRDTAGAAVSETPRLCCDGLNVYVAWSDRRNAAPRRDVYVNSSTDGGATWRNFDIRVDTRNGDSEGVQICCAAQNVYVVWTDDTFGQRDIRFNSSSASGLSWQTQDVRLDFGDLDGRNASLNPQICCDGLDVYAVWQDDRNDPGGDNDIFTHYSADGGVTWPVAPRLVDHGNGNADNPFICCEGLDVYVAWRDDRNGATDIYANYSRNRGINWDPADNRLDTGDTAGASDSRGSKICCANGVVYVVWADSRDGSEDVYVNYSIDAGVSFQGTDQRLDGGDAPGGAESDEIRVCSDGARVYVVWEELRNAAKDVFVNGSP